MPLRRVKEVANTENDDEIFYPAEKATNLYRVVGIGFNQNAK